MTKATNNSHVETLISVKQNLNVGDWEISNKTLPLDTDIPWHIKKYTLHGGMQEGVEIIEVFNGKLTMKIIPTRGMNVLNVQSGDVQLGWQSPVKQVVHPQFVNLEENNGLGWLYSFNEWTTRCGMAFSGHPGMDNGRFLSLHGRMAHIPASEVTIKISKTAPHRITIVGEVEEVHFKFCNFLLTTEISMDLDSRTFTFNDTVTNRATNEEEFIVLYHTNYGNPILEEGATLHGTIDKIMPFDQDAAGNIGNWATYGPPAQKSSSEQVYCITPRADTSGNAHFMLENSTHNKGIYFHFSIAQFPYLTQWKSHDSMTNGYVTGLEPGTGFPYNRAWERKYNRVPKLAGGESRNFTLSYTILATQSKVTEARTKIEALNGDKKITIITTPEADPRDKGDQ